MTYRIIIPKLVQKQLDDLPQKQRKCLISAIRLLADEPRPSGVKKLKGKDIIMPTIKNIFGPYRFFFTVLTAQNLNTFIFKEKNFFANFG